MDNAHQLSVDMYMRDLYTLKKSNLLIEKINTFSFNTQKIFNLILWEFQHQETPTHHIQMPVHKMVELVGKKEVYRTKLFYQKIAKCLVQKTLDLIEPREDAVDVTNLISRFTLEKGMIDIRVTDEFLELAGIHKAAAKERESKKHAKVMTQAGSENGQSKNFAKDFQAAGTDKKGIAKYGYTKINLYLVNGLKSKHTMSLYEFLLMKLHYHTFKKHQRDSLEITLDLNMLRKMLCHHHKSYEDFDLFHRKILKPALNEINEKTDLIVETQLQKSLNKVHAILFSMRKKKDFILQIEGSSGTVMPFTLHQEPKTFATSHANLNVHSYDAKPQPAPFGSKPQTQSPSQPFEFDKNWAAKSNQNPAVNAVRSKKALLDIMPDTLSQEVKDMILEIKSDPHQQALERDAKIKQQKTRARHKSRMQEIAEAQKNGVRYTGEHDTQDYFQHAGGVMGNVLDDLMLTVQKNMEKAANQADQFNGSENVSISQRSNSPAPLNARPIHHHTHTSNASNDTDVRKDFDDFLFANSPSANQAHSQTAVSHTSSTPSKYQRAATHSPAMKVESPPDVFDPNEASASRKKNKKMNQTSKIENSQSQSKTKSNSKDQGPRGGQGGGGTPAKSQAKVKGHKAQPTPIVTHVPADVEQALRRLTKEELNLFHLLEERKKRKLAGEPHPWPEDFLTIQQTDLLAYVRDPKSLKEAILPKIWHEKKACLNEMLDPKSIYHQRPGSFNHAHAEYKKVNGKGFPTEITERDKLPYYSIGALAARLDQPSVEKIIDTMVTDIFEKFSIFQKNVSFTALGRGYDISDFQRISSVARDSYGVHIHELNFSLFPNPEKRFLITYNIIKDQYLDKPMHERKLLFVKIFNDATVPELTDPIRNEAIPSFSDAYTMLKSHLGRFETLERRIKNELRFHENRLIREHQTTYFKHAVQQEWHVIHRIWQRFLDELAKSGVPNAQKEYAEDAILYFETKNGHEIWQDHDFYTDHFEDKNIYIAFKSNAKQLAFAEKLMYTIDAAVKSLGIQVKPRIGT